MQVKLKKIDYWLVIPYLILMAIGIVMVYSASSAMLLENGLSPTSYFKKQLIYVVLGICAFFFFYLLKLNVILSRRFIISFVLLALISLLGLVVLKYLDPSSARNGAVGWFNFGPISIQPVEFAKLALVLYLARIFHQHHAMLTQSSLRAYYTPPVVIYCLMVFLVLLQPDLGGIGILTLIFVVILFAAGIKWYWTVFSGLTSAGAIYAVAFELGNARHIPFFKSYQLARFQAFVHPFRLESKSGMQLVNSYYAINNGGLWGRGLGNSIQKKGYLPEPYTDFILAIIAEELGVVGVIVILSLLGVLLTRIIVIGIQSRRKFNALICYGVSAILFAQTLFNVGAVVGLLPITGVTLPFISYGGSSLLVLSISLAIVMNIEVNEKQRLEKEVSHV